MYGVLIHCRIEWIENKRKTLNFFFTVGFYLTHPPPRYLSVFVFIFIRLLISTSREVVSGVHPTYSHNNAPIQTYSSKQPGNNHQSPFDKQYLTINTGNCFNTIPISHPFCHIFDLKEGGYYRHILLPKQNHCHGE